MSNFTKGKTVAEFAQGGHNFKVCEAVPGDGAGFDYAGYCDGVLSVSSDRADVATRALVRKHCVGLPEGKLVDFAAAKATRAT